MFDKTGTLTEGRPSVTEVQRFGRRTGRRTTCCGSRPALERLSEHPLAQAVVRAAREKNLPTDRRSMISPMSRAKASRDGSTTPPCWSEVRALCGKKGRFRSTDARRRSKPIKRGRKPSIVVARNGEAIGVIAIADTLKSDAKAAIAQLRAEGIVTVMITGDNRKTAEAIAEQLDIDQVFAEVLPQDKAQQVQRLQTEGQARRLRRRRHQRCARARAGRSWHRDRHRHRHRDRGRQHRARQRQSAENHRGAAAVAR